jgi:hypothetical protein
MGKYRWVITSGTDVGRIYCRCFRGSLGDIRYFYASGCFCASDRVTSNIFAFRDRPVDGGGDSRADNRSNNGTNVAADQQPDP